MRLNRQRNNNDTRNTMIRIVTAMFLLTIAFIIIRAFMRWLSPNTQDNERGLSPNTPINNPYGDAMLCGRDIWTPQPISNLEECHAIEHQVFTDTTYPYQSSTAINCIRKMTGPTSECFSQAIVDGVNALRMNDEDAFHRIMYSWPAQVRKKFHDTVIQEIRGYGIIRQSSMPPFDPNAVRTTQLDQIRAQPYRRDFIASTDVNEQQNRMRF